MRKDKKHFMGHEHKSTAKASRQICMNDLHWVAGFLEGEAYFGRTVLNRDGSSTERITVRQNDRQTLDQLHDLLGGNVRIVQHRTNKLARQPFIWDWGIHGSRARGAMMTLYPLMSDKRKQQIKSSLQ